MKGTNETKVLSAMNKTKLRFLHIALPIGIVGIGILAMGALTATKSKLKKHKPAAPAPMVRTMEIKTGPQTIHIFGEGTVQPLQEIDLVPQVTGKVVFVSPDLVNGGAFHQGDILLRIDPDDYQLAATSARAKVKETESRLQLAEEEAAAARLEWRTYQADSSSPDKNPPPLVAKEPQLAAAKAELEAVRADLQKALLDLERTELKAPFDGRVSQESLDIGQYVLAGKALATLYSTEAVEIMLPLEDDAVFWFNVPGFSPGDLPGSRAEIRARIAGLERTWPGTVVRSEGKLDERTRMINVVIRAQRPYAKRPPLAVGLFVTVDIKGRTLPNAAVIPRSALHEDNIVWVADRNNRLHFQKVEVARAQGNQVIVKAGLKNGQKVVITALKAVTDGMTVRVAHKGDGRS